MRIAAFALATTLVLASFGAGVAQAQDFEAAGKHFQAAQGQFSASHFRTAATQFQAAYDITKDPILLYNIGEAWQKGGEGHKAVTAYRAYLKAQPTAQDRGEVQKRIRLIEGRHFKLKDQSSPGDDPEAFAAQMTAPATPAPPSAAPSTATTPGTAAAAANAAPSAAPASAAPAAPAPAPAPAAPAPAAAAPAPAPAPVAQANDAEKSPPASSGTSTHLGFLDESKPSTMRVAAWIGVAATVAVLTTGAILGLAAQSRADEISRRFEFVDSNGQPKKFDASQQSDYNNLKSDGQLYNGLAIGFFSAAGALAVVTTVLFVVDHSRGSSAHAERTPRLAPVFGKSGAGLAATWRF